MEEAYGRHRNTWSQLYQNEENLEELTQAACCFGGQANTGSGPASRIVIEPAAASQWRASRGPN